MVRTPYFVFSESIIDFACTVKILNIEKYLWNKFYQRRDQDPDRYAAYLAAEGELSSQ